MTTEEGNKLIAEFMGFPKPVAGMVVCYNRSVDNSQISFPTIKEVTDRYIIFNEKMGFEGYGIEYFDGVVFKPKDFKSTSHSPSKPYHTSWDWLMPVVEKIEAMYESAFFNICNKEVNVIIHSNDTPIYEYSDSASSKIKATLKAVVEFIQWHNQAGKEQGK